MERKRNPGWDKDTAEMIAAINRNADRAYARRCAAAACEEILLEQEERERRMQKWSAVCITAGVVMLITAYGLIWCHGTQMLAAYGG